MKALSTRNDEPQRASRPWDENRDGFVLGEGAAVLILEEYEAAKARGARIYCELTGYGASSDAYHMTNPAPGGAGAVQAMKMAMADAGVNASEVGYINAHGTSTPVGDLAESEAIKAALGADIAKKCWISSTKSMTGHGLGAAGAVESVFSILALYHGKVPPTINLDSPSLDCDLDYVPNTAREKQLHHVLNNSFGFGGTNACLLFSKI
jgi:3-oxoacyl-[acyl-carrier-protein] synthase II